VYTALPMTTKEAANEEANILPQKQQQKQEEPISGKRIIVRNLPVGISKEELRELGDRYGRVVNVELVSNPAYNTNQGKVRLPFGFISFLSEDDASYSIYRLNDFYYKGEHLSASLSKPNATQNNKSKTGGVANRGPQNDAKNKKKNTNYYSLRSLTPLNPPSLPPQQSQGAQHAPKAWDQPAPAQVNSNSNPPTDNNGYVQNNQGGKQGGRKNNTNNRNNRKQNYKAVPDPIEDIPTESSIGNYSSNIAEPITHDVAITIDSTQQWYSFKLTDDQLQEFYKAIEPFVPQQ